MKRVIGIAVLAAAIGSGAGAAEAQSFEKPFAEIGLGITSSGDYQFGAIHWDDDRSVSGRLSFGFENFIGPLELRADYLSTGIGDIFEDMDISSFMLSGVLNHEVNDWLTIYAGGGAGIAMSDYTGGSLAQYPGLHSEDTQPTWMVMAGARAQLFNSPASIFLEGQYHAASDFEIAPGAIAEYSVLGAMTGLRWNF